MSDYKIVNGVDKVLTLEENIEDDTVVIVKYFPPFAKSPIDSPIRYIRPQFNRRFHILGEYAFYLGEEIHISSIVKEAEELIDKIK